MALKLYPIGIQTFEEIIHRDLLYIDKTEYIYRMSHSGGKHFFLGRPRRFGKSLLVSTMQSYFEGKKELFKGLAMENLEKEWTEYPVLHFDMSGGKHMEKEQLERYLADVLEEQETKWGYHSKKIDANLRLKDLIDFAYEKTGKQVVVLIDEYDAPLLDVAHEKEQLDELRNIMRNFFSPLKMREGKLRFVFLTGITKFSQLSIFSELNNITNISMDDEYAGICGITKEELLENMSEDIEMLAKAQDLSVDQTTAKLKEYYDGYHFSKASPDVFNPYSLLNCFAKRELGTYWFASGTPTYLINTMKKLDTLPTDIGRIEADESEFDAPTENMNTIMPLLYQSGYVTIKGYDPETELYTLGLPNKEVRIGLFRSLLPHYLATSTAMGNTTIAKMSVMIKRGQIDDALALFNTFLSTVPYCDNTHYEGHYQQLMYIVFALLTNFRILVEQHTAKGRTDITMETDQHVYVIELKFAGNAHDALEQINRQRYADAFALQQKRVVKVGMNFEVKDGVCTIEWETV